MRQRPRNHYGRERDGISRRDVDELYPRMRDAHAYLTSARDPKRGHGHAGHAEQSASPMNKIVRPLLGVGAGAALTGLLTGRLNHWNFPGTPLPIGLTFALAGQAINYFDLAGPFSQDLGNAGLGAFASWLTMLSTGWGQQLRDRAGQPLGPIMAGVGSAPAIGTCACGQPRVAGSVGCSCGTSTPAALPPSDVSVPQPQPQLQPQPQSAPRPLTEADIAAMSHAMRSAA